MADGRPGRNWGDLGGAGQDSDDGRRLKRCQEPLFSAEKNPPGSNIPLDTYCTLVYNSATHPAASRPAGPLFDNSTPTPKTLHQRRARSAAGVKSPPTAAAYRHSRFTTVSARFVHRFLLRFPPLKPFSRFPTRKLCRMTELPARHFPANESTFATKLQGQNSANCNEPIE